MTNPWRDPGHSRRFHGGAADANPSRPEQVEVLLTLAAAHKPRRILDAGCGPGILAERLLAACPGAELVGFDLAPEMVAAARARLGARARIEQASFEEEWEGAAGGPFDLVVCVQAVHHADDATKRRALAGFRRVLRPGGLYLQSDPVAFGAAALFPQLKALWDRLRGQAGFPPLPAAYGLGDAEHEARARGDFLASLEDHLRWLREAGFDPVDCLWRHGNRAVVLGLRPR